MVRGPLEPHLIVIFGGTGDLARRKLLPALAGLAGRGRLPSGTAVLALGRSDMTDEKYREWARESLTAAGSATSAALSWCDAGLHYQPIGEGAPEDYRALTGDGFDPLDKCQRTSTRAMVRRPLSMPATGSASLAMSTRR